MTTGDQLKGFSWDALTLFPISQGGYDVTADTNLAYSTVLGSCVAVCMTDTNIRVGGMNHFLLPGIGEDPTAGERFGVNAMEMLINGLLRLGAERSSLTAKIFGGSTMSQMHSEIGKSNGAFAKDFLQNEGISCTLASIGGNFARRIHFHPTSGRAKQLKIDTDVDGTQPLPSAKWSSNSRPDITLF